MSPPLFPLMLFRSRSLPSSSFFFLRSTDEVLFPKSAHAGFAPQFYKPLRLKLGKQIVKSKQLSAAWQPGLLSVEFLPNLGIALGCALA